MLKLMESAVSSYELLEAMHQIVCDLNGYNRQFQLLNQDSVNLPVYEIQSKVNSEKYMAAYCSLIHKCFALYYKKEKSEANVVQGLPLALVDINQRRVGAFIFFPEIYADGTKKDNKCV